MGATLSGLHKDKLLCIFNAMSKTSVSGFLARDAFRQVMRACTYTHHGVADVFVAEARAFALTVIFA